MPKKRAQLTQLLPSDIIENKILLIRQKKVLMDRDLAVLYDVSTGNLNKAVKRNIKRFPEDFMFQLNKHETESLSFHSGSLKEGSSIESLRFQVGSPKQGRGGRRYLPYVFTQKEIAMLSSVLNSDRAIIVNIQIMRAFVKLRELMISHKDLAQKIHELKRKHNQHDKNILVIFEALKRLMQPAQNPIGLHPQE